MKKATLSLTSLAALTVTTVAFGQEPAQGGPTPTLPVAAEPVVAPTPITPVPQTSLVTLTAADATAMPPPRPPPPRETITLRQSYRPNRTLLYTGGSMLLSSYAATAGFTFTQDVRDASGDQPLFIPVAGPWMHLANSSEGMLDKVLIAGSGVAQGAGVVIGVLSFIIPERIPSATIQAGDVKIDFSPASFGRGSGGIRAVGRF
jgi:hypothetical protein